VPRRRKTALTLGLGALHRYDFTKIRTAIGWRNDIVHKYGHLNRDVPTRDVAEGISQVLALAVFVDSKYEELMAEPRLRQSSQEMQTELGTGLGRPLISLRSPGRHRVFVDFRYIAGKPNQAEMLYNENAHRLAETTTGVSYALRPSSN